MKERKNYIKWEDITMFLCENHVSNNFCLPPGVVIPTKMIPLKKIADSCATERIVREIDIHAPIVYLDTNKGLRRLNKEKIQIDSYNHNNGSIMKTIYAEKINKIIVLDKSTNVFIVYNNKCTTHYTFRPINSFLKEQTCIDFAWSDNQRRVGGLFKDNHLAFWDSSDNFTFEKTFHVSQHILEEQTNIWYISYIDKWITSDNK